MTLFYERYMDIAIWKDWEISNSKKKFWFEFQSERYEKDTPVETRALIRSLIAQQEKQEQLGKLQIEKVR